MFLKPTRQKTLINIVDWVDKIFSKTVCFLIVFFPIVSFAAVSDILFPYQNCDDSSLNYSNRIVSEVDAFLFKYGLKEEISKEQTTESELFYFKGESMIDVIDEEIVFQPAVPKECFLAIALKGIRIFSDERHSYCSRTTDIRPSASRKLCINEDYIDMVYTAFAEMSMCFNYDEKRQLEVFRLISQESSWLLNIRSPTGARCLGQLTSDNIETVNNYISFSKSSESSIYNKVITRCPFLEDKILKDEDSLTCRMTHDPYTCLFYTFFDLEKNNRSIKENLQRASNHIESKKEFFALKKQKFKLPIKLNEMLAVWGEFDGREVNWLFWDDSEVYDTFNRFPDERLAKLETKKVPIFKNQKEVELLFNYWAHNGGAILTGDHMISMIKKMKQKLALSCDPESEAERCRLREIVQRGEGLDTDIWQSYFDEDLFEYYPHESEERRKEVASYIRDIADKNKNVFSYQKGTKNTNIMLDYYEKAVQSTSRNIYLSNEDAVNFQKHIAQECLSL